MKFSPEIENFSKIFKETENFLKFTKFHKIFIDYVVLIQKLKIISIRTINIRYPMFYLTV